MNGQRFDAMARAWCAGTRRSLIAAVWGSAATLVGLLTADAKKKRGKGKRKKKKNKCNANTCPTGCCQKSKCLPGTANDACQTGGLECEDCSADGLRCDVSQTCRCDPSKCEQLDGCCDPREPWVECLVGQSEDACGSDGNVCEICDSDHECAMVDDGNSVSNYRCCGTEGVECDWQLDRHGCCLGYTCVDDTCRSSCVEPWGKQRCADGEFCCASLGLCLHNPPLVNCRDAHGTVAGCPSNTRHCCYSHLSSRVSCKADACPVGEGFYELDPIVCPD